MEKALIYKPNARWLHKSYVYTGDNTGSNANLTKIQKSLNNQRFEACVCSNLISDKAGLFSNIQLNDLSSERR